MSKRILIVGGGSSAGLSALRAAREHWGTVEAIGTTSRSEPLPDYTRTIPNIDLSSHSREMMDRLASEVSTAPDLLVFTPAFGPLGFPVRASTPEQIDEALSFSVDPMERLAGKLNPGLTVSYSAFYWLPHTLAAYGSMAYAKIRQEQLALASPDRFRTIRAGTFRSKATRGITILLQRQMKSGGGPDPSLVAAWKESGKKFGEFFFEYAFGSEERSFGDRFDSPHRETESADLTAALAMILTGERAPIVNVIGAWRWTDTTLPTLGGDFAQLAHLDRRAPASAS